MQYTFFRFVFDNLFSVLIPFIDAFDGDGEALNVEMIFSYIIIDAKLHCFYGSRLGTGGVTRITGVDIF